MVLDSQSSGEINTDETHPLFFTYFISLKGIYTTEDTIKTDKFGLTITQ